jgi:ADP-ribose pyrophosphatase YjhB (NUDIX family)
MQVTRIAAYGLLVESGKLLLCRLSESVPLHAGKWTLPGGGIEFGEPPEQAMVREFSEETGLIVAVDSLAGIRSISDTKDNKFHSIQIVYHASLSGGTLRFETEGTTDRCEWFPIETVAALPKVGLVAKGLELLKSKAS